MRKIILLYIMLLPIGSYCQMADSGRTKRTEFGITYSFDYAYRILKADAESKPFMDMRDTLETAKLGYTTGLNIVFHTPKKVSVAVGVLFSDKGEKIKKYSLNTLSGDMPVSNTLIYHYQYIAVPVKINYYLVTGKIKVFVCAGLSANVFLAQKTTSVLEYYRKKPEKSSSTVTSGFSKINFALIAGLGMDCALSNKFNFKLEPLYTRSIHSIIKAPIKEYLYSAGLTLGLYYKF